MRAQYQVWFKLFAVQIMFAWVCTMHLCQAHITIGKQLQKEGNRKDVSMFNLAEMNSVAFRIQNNARHYRKNMDFRRSE
jgi:hypothetical protein